VTLPYSEQGGLLQHGLDVAIAAIAKSRELVIVTLNLRNFEPIGVNARNPFHLD
jgi:hypothetical protein